jgi:hypothetical protein
MLPSPKQLIALLDGRGPDKIAIGQMPVDIGAYIGARTSNVLLGREYARKLIGKHNLQHTDFEIIQTALDEGWAGIDRRGTTPELLFVYCDPFNSTRNFKLVVKRNADGVELLVKTFHRIKKDQYTKLLRGIEIMREHLEMTPGNE